MQVTHTKECGMSFTAPFFPPSLSSKKEPPMSSHDAEDTAHMYILTAGFSQHSHPQEFAALKEGLRPYDHAHMGGGTWFVYFSEEEHDKKEMDAGLLLDLVSEGIPEDKDLAVAVVEVESNMATFGTPAAVDTLMHRMFTLDDEDE